METHRVALGNLHRLQLGHFGALGHAVFAIVGQVTHICDVSHIPHLITQVQQIAINHIEAAKGAAVAEVHIVINRWATNIHPTWPGVMGRNSSFFPERVLWILSGRCSVIVAKVIRWLLVVRALCLAFR
jgi:hypothetical protein